MDEYLLNLPRPDKIEGIWQYVNAWKGIRAELERSIQSIPEDVFIQPMADGTWSAAEITEHVAQTQCRFARVIPLILKGRIGMDADGDQQADYALIEKYFQEHRKVKNPDAVTPVKIQGKEKSLEALVEAMALFEKNISGVALSSLQKKAFEHFLFGPINLVEYTWVLAMHENHHTYILRKQYF